MAENVFLKGGAIMKKMSAPSLILILSFISLGLAMLVWPEAVPQENLVCMDPDELIGCFIQTSWGSDGGVFLVVISLAIFAWLIFTSSRQESLM